MSSSPELVSFICEQAGGAGQVAARKMFGEYAVYCDGKVVGLICDDRLFIKETEAGRVLLGEVVEDSPYEGSKPCFVIESLDDREWLSALIRATCDALPVPKPKKKKSKD